MVFLDAIKTCLKKSFSIEGCASRSEYWWFTAFQYLGIILFCIIISMLDAVDTEAMLVPFLIFVILIFPASFCVTIRRFHDQDKSGWNILWGAIPYLGGLVILIFMLSGSNPNSRFRTQEEKENLNMPKL